MIGIYKLYTQFHISIHLVLIKGSDDSLQKILEIYFSSHIFRHHPKLKGPKADAAKHSQELKAFLDEKRAKVEKADSGVGFAVSDDEEMVGARVLAENNADLAAEGVKVSSASSSGLQVCILTVSVYLMKTKLKDT